MRVSLRELFLLVALAAVGCGWWLDHRQQTRWSDALTEQIKERFGELVALGPDTTCR